MEDEEEDSRDLENLLERLACLRLATCPGCNWCKVRAPQPCHLATLSRVPQPVDQLPIDSVSHQVQLGLRNIAQLTEQLRAGFHTEEEIIRLNNHLAYEQDNLLATAKEDRAWTLVVRRSFKRATMGRTLPQPAHLRRLAQARRAARIGSTTPSTSTSDITAKIFPSRVVKSQQPTTPPTSSSRLVREQRFLEKEHASWLQDNLLWIY